MSWSWISWALGLVTVAAGLGWMASSRPRPLTDEELESWRSRHPLTPAPEHTPANRAACARLAAATVTTAAALAALAVVAAMRSAVHAYAYVAGAFLALLWPAACKQLAALRSRGALSASTFGLTDLLGRGRNHEARRWELLDLYGERLAGEIATGVASTRSDLARRARRVFRRPDDHEFLRHLRAHSGSEAYRRAAAQVLEDLGA